MKRLFIASAFALVAVVVALIAFNAVSRFETSLSLTAGRGVTHIEVGGEKLDPVLVNKEGAVLYLSKGCHEVAWDMPNERHTAVIELTGGFAGLGIGRSPPVDTMGGIRIVSHIVSR